MAIHGDRRNIRAMNYLNHGDRFLGYQKIRHECKIPKSRLALLRGVGGIEIFILPEVYLIKLYFYQQLTPKNGNILYLIQDYHESGLFPEYPNDQLYYLW
jgi:hypothetical protein